MPHGSGLEHLFSIYDNFPVFMSQFDRNNEIMICADLFEFVFHVKTCNSILLLWVCVCIVRKNNTRRETISKTWLCNQLMQSATSLELGAFA